MPSRGPKTVKAASQRFCRHLVQLQIATQLLPCRPGTAAPPSTLNTMTRLARLRMGTAKAVARACSVLQFHAIKTFVSICGCGDGGAIKIGRPLSNKAASRFSSVDPSHRDLV
jgi:hypothetical protein